LSAVVDHMLKADISNIPTPGDIDALQFSTAVEKQKIIYIVNYFLFNEISKRILL